MSNDKAIAIIPRTLDEVRSLSKTFSQSNLLPSALRGKEADVFVSIIAGQELGLPPMASIRGVHVVSGKPVLAADTMVGVVHGSGLAEYFICIDDTPTSVTYETKRKGAPQPQRCTWTMEDAKLAGLLGNDSWRKYPRAMLKARCKAMLARDAYPDVLAGCYEPDEAREFADAPPSSPPPAPRPSRPEAVDAEFSETPAAFDLDAIDRTTSELELRSLVPAISALPESLKVQARHRYGERQKMLRIQEAPAEAAP